MHRVTTGGSAERQGKIRQRCWCRYKAARSRARATATGNQVATVERRQVRQCVHCVMCRLCVSVRLLECFWLSMEHAEITYSADKLLRCVEKAGR